MQQKLKINEYIFEIKQNNIHLIKYNVVILKMVRR